MRGPGVNERRTLAAVSEVLEKTGRFPTVDEIAATGRVTNRGHASNALRKLEERRLVSRTGHGWRTGSMSTHAMGRVAVYLADPARWLQPPRKHARAERARPEGVLEGTLHPHRVKFPAGGNPLRSGSANQKLGGWVTKGRWAGARIMTLALEERRTCPASCAQWDTCYGDNMSLALRTPHGPDLERRLVEQLGRIHAEVVAVRLHELGDFYSVAYAELWGTLLRRHPWLHVFGYTAWTPRTPIGAAVQTLNREHPERCWIRTSGFGAEMGAYVVKPGDRRPDAFACPEQHNRVANCGACGACWSTRKSVSFEEH